MKNEKKGLQEPDDLISVNETERLRRDMNRPDMEKLQLFTKMLRTNLILKKAVIRHK
ncbi:hypothetical protein [Mucilaginibacter sp. AK015]|uniref:hypothetical protein n=1 Tax=Mucilaginibacter sp. AK015 TaxID=2723072 RepID=UPI00160A1B0E|nr:hypothetical protein [Mucilaginibacter sp. AK015]MBB5394554.1 hypothetical protein [Mucilaginibacter sp. AK015]